MQEAINETLKTIKPYLRQDQLNDAQAAVIGRTLFSNLKKAKEDAKAN
jgi:transcriptional regulator NrdR family protein